MPSWLPNASALSWASWSASDPRSRFHARRIATVAGSMSTTRGLAVLVSPSLICRACPFCLMTPTDRRTLTVPASRTALNNS